MAALAAAQVSKREDAKKRNREDFPFAAEMADLLAEFQPKLIYAEQNGRSIGKKPQDDPYSLDGDRLVQMHDQFERTSTLMNKRRK
jgi:hypothetical protein